MEEREERHRKEEIAKFLGWKFEPSPFSAWYKDGIQVGNYMDMKFQTWNWIMPVFKKITAIWKSKESLPDGCEIAFCDIHYAIDDVDEMKMFIAVSDFCQIYNSK